jgi:hypothetical protein
VETRAILPELLDPYCVRENTLCVTPDSSLRKLLDELEANRRSRRTAWLILQRLRKLLEENGVTISTPENRTFETEGEVIERERAVQRTIEHRDVVTLNLIRAIYRFRDAVLVDEKKGDFPTALQNLYGELARAEELVRPPGPDV